MNEEELIAAGDGVFSATATYGGFKVRKALQGATLWEVEHYADTRRFFRTLSEAVTSVEDQVRELRTKSTLPSALLDRIYNWKVEK